jgi:NAD(P)H-hydrate epimerase
MAPPALAADAHKGDAGRVLIVAGSAMMPGAAILAGRGALRAGAGLVTIACQDRTLTEILPAAIPEATYLDIDGRAFGGLLAERADHAIACGPGLGVAAGVRDLVDVLVQEFTGPVVLDADALNVLGPEPERLADAVCQLVLTPHPGEASRLLGREISAEAEDRRDAAMELARRAGAVVCLKGRGTVVTDGERTEVNETGNPGLATAGSGDVLSGICAAYLASSQQDPSGGFDVLRAARAAVHVHGLAGDLARDELGERAVTASDLIAHLPAAQAEHLAATAEEER